MPAIVKVRVVAARDLPVMDRSSELTDAFVEVQQENLDRERSREREGGRERERERKREREREREGGRVSYFSIISLAYFDAVASRSRIPQN